MCAAGFRAGPSEPDDAVGILRQRAADTQQWPAGVDASGLDAPAQPSFAVDVEPILQRVLRLQWTSQLARLGNDTKHRDMFAKASPPTSDKDSRDAIVASLIPPGTSPTSGSMPLIWGDNYNIKPPQTVMTATQHKILQNWAKSGWTDPPSSPPSPFRPEDLTRAMLESCAGGAFVPGIEASRFLRDDFACSEPFRLDHDSQGPDGNTLEAGDLTKQMSCPWQTDFFMCKLELGLAWWPAQRPDDVYPELLLKTGAADPATWKAESWTRELLSPAKNPGRKEMTEQWHKLGFVVRRGDAFVETECRKVCAQLSLIVDRTRFSSSEIAEPPPTELENAFYVVVEGLTPAQLGATAESDLDPDTLAGKAIAPAIDLATGGATLKEAKASVQQVLLELLPFDPNALQRLTFVYKVVFAGTKDFDPLGDRIANVLATLMLPGGADTYTAGGTIVLAAQPDPYMLDGNTPWLSDDLRVFTVVVDGPAPEGLPTLTAPPSDDQKAWDAAATGYISQVIKTLNQKGDGNPFIGLPAGQQESQLELAEKVGSDRVLNFAVARVRYRGKVPASNVRVFFRLFTTAATGLEYDSDTTYRRSEGNKPAALAGLVGGNVVSIPCYAAPRAEDPSNQNDPLNVIDFSGNPEGEEVQHYVGCWLDFNQTAKLFPKPTEPGQLFSIQELIRGLHQCLVAEILVGNGQIAEGATPAANDGLAQRNLMIVDSDNPGAAATRVIQHTFEAQATRLGMRSGAEAIAMGAPAASGQGPGWRPDEIMIRWGSLPRTAKLTLYLPDIDAAEIARLAGQSYEAVRIELVDAHTLRCLPGDVTYVPLPGRRSRNSPGLLTVELPEGVRLGQRFDLVMQQVSGAPRRLVGAFQLAIPVSDRRALLPAETRGLSVMRHIAKSIRPDDPWNAVFVRYLDWMAARVRGFGGDPDSVIASPDGSGRDLAADACARQGWAAAALLALFVALAGLHPIAGYLLEAVAAAAAIAIGGRWIAKCAPTICQILLAAMAGLVVGAAILGVLWLAGAAGAHAMPVLAVAAILLGLLAVAGLLSRCAVGMRFPLP